MQKNGFYYRFAKIIYQLNFMTGIKACSALDLTSQPIMVDLGAVFSL
jgi:hypothetical protein